MLTILPKFLFLSVECENYNQLENGSIGEKYLYIYIHTHTHTHFYIYVFMCVCMKVS